jgi:hypothetical protein
MSNFAIEPSIVPSKPNSIQKIYNCSFNRNLALRRPRSITQLPNIFNGLEMQGCIQDRSHPTPKIKSKRAFKK